MKSGNPTWLGDRSVKAVAPASIDKINVSIDKGLISFDKFEFNEKIKEVNLSKLDSFAKLDKMYQIIGQTGLPDYFLKVLKDLSPNGNSDLAIHNFRSIMSYKSGEPDYKNIYRKEDFLVETSITLFQRPFIIYKFFIMT